MKIEKEKKKRVFQLFFKDPNGMPKYEIVFVKLIKENKKEN